MEHKILDIFKERETLLAQIVQKDKIISDKNNTISKNEFIIAYLTEQVRLLQIRNFGKKSEIFKNLTLLFNEPEELSNTEPEADKVPVAPHTRSRKKKSRVLPENIERVEVVHDIEEKTCPTHGCELQRIGEDRSEKLEIVPARLKIEVHVRPKYICPCCEDNPVTQKPMPAQIIPKSFATASLLAYIAVSKYVDHLPLYRLETIFERAGVDISRTVQARWMIKLGEVLTPLYNLLQDKLLESRLIQVDETSVQVLKEPEREATQKSYMWVRTRPPTLGPPIVLYDYYPSRGAEVLRKILVDFNGCLQSDGYAAYDTYALSRNLIHAGCWAHTRRKFVEAFKVSKKKDLIAAQALKLIQTLYKIEKEAKGMSATDRLHHRQKFLTPIIDEIKTLMNKHLPNTPNTLAIGKALHYMAGQWDKLVLILKNGDILIDTNWVENYIRPFALGRKNWLFSLSVKGAEASAMIYSILVTAKANGLDEFSYLYDVLKKIPFAKTLSDYIDLLPEPLKKEFLTET
jgi:transposase